MSNQQVNQNNPGPAPARVLPQDYTPYNDNHFKRKLAYAPFNDVYENYVAPPAPPSSRNYGFDVSAYLPQVVGSRTNRDIVIKNAWQAPASFAQWKLDKDGQPIPERANYEGIDQDVDKDGIPEFIVKKDGRIVGVNGYTTKKSEYPYRKAYYETYPTRDARLDHHMGDYMTAFDPQLNINNLNATWTYNEEQLRQMGIKQKQPNQVSPYQHFVKMLAKPLFDKAKDVFATANAPPELKDKVSVPGTLFTQLSSQAWSTFIIKPITNRKPDLKNWLADKAYQFVQKAQYDGKEITREKAYEKAWQAFKSNSQFKKDVAEAYSTLLSRPDFLDALGRFYVSQFPYQYSLLTDGKVKFKASTVKHDPANPRKRIAELPVPTKWHGGNKRFMGEDEWNQYAIGRGYRAPEQNENENQNSNDNQNIQNMNLENPRQSPKPTLTRIPTRPGTPDPINKNQSQSQKPKPTRQTNLNAFIKQ